MLAIDYRMTYRAVATDPSVTDTFSFWARASMRSLFFAHRYSLHLILDASSRARFIRKRVYLVRASLIISLAFQAQRSYQLRRSRPRCSNSRSKRHCTPSAVFVPVPLGHHQLEPLGYVAAANLDSLRKGLQGSWVPPASGSPPYSLPSHLSRAGHAHNSSLPISAYQPSIAHQSSRSLTILRKTRCYNCQLFIRVNPSSHHLLISITLKSFAT